MKIIYAVNNGGSAPDILGLFESRELAESVLAMWRANMGVNDDGWGIQELTIWDRAPKVNWMYSVFGRIDLEGRTSTIQVQKQPVFEWDRQKPEERVISHLLREGWYACAVNADESTARRQLDKALAHGRTQIAADKQARIDAETASRGVLDFLVETIECPSCHQPAVRAQSIYPDKVTLVCAAPHIWETRRMKRG